jgi:hypothetical protein
MKPIVAQKKYYLRERRGGGIKRNIKDKSEKK